MNPIQGPFFSGTFFSVPYLSVWTDSLPFLGTNAGHRTCFRMGWLLSHHIKSWRKMHHRAMRVRRETVERKATFWRGHKAHKGDGGGSESRMPPSLDEFLDDLPFFTKSLCHHHLPNYILLHPCRPFTQSIFSFCPLLLLFTPVQKECFPLHL